jgi:hypothetical protein
MLNTPSNNLVLNDDFLPMVKRLEECLSYLGEHVSVVALQLASDTGFNEFGADTRRSLQRDFKDAELYLIRYQQCMTRSMTLIKIYFVNTIKSLGLEVGAKLAQRVRQFEATRSHASPGYVSCRADRRRTSRTPPLTLCSTPSSPHSQTRFARSSPSWRRACLPAQTTLRRCLQNVTRPG